MKQTLEHYLLPPQYLELELTESIAMQNAELAIEITHQLTQLGIVLNCQLMILAPAIRR